MIDAPTILTILRRALDDFSIHGVLGYSPTTITALGVWTIRILVLTIGVSGISRKSSRKRKTGSRGMLFKHSNERCRLRVV